MAPSTSSYNADRESSLCFGACAQAVDEPDDDYTLSLQLMSAASTYFTWFDAKDDVVSAFYMPLKISGRRSLISRTSLRTRETSDCQKPVPRGSSYFLAEIARILSVHGGVSEELAEKVMECELMVTWILSVLFYGTEIF